MEKYLTQLLADIAQATKQVAWPIPPPDCLDWVSEEEEDKAAPRRELEEWTGIQQAQLPPADQLTDEQLQVLFEALKKMLDEYNCIFCLMFAMPERVQYEVLRTNFSQVVLVKRWHMGLFDTCKPGTDTTTCIMGEACHCEYFNELSKNWIEEDLTPEEERRRHLEIEIRHLKRKHGDRWMRYYPYHLDPDYDDKNGNAYDYGFGEESDDEDDEDNWWKK